jgi:hypothetical protein
MNSLAVNARTKMNSLERRLHGRKTGSGSIFFASPIRIYEGALLNYSRSGLAIRVSEKFAEGQILVVALPFSDGAPDKCKARVAWCSGKAFGAKFIR